MMFARVVFPRPGGPLSKNVLKDIVPFLGGFDQKLKTFAHFHLTGELAEHRRPERNFENGIGLRWVHWSVESEELKSG